MKKRKREFKEKLQVQKEKGGSLEESLENSKLKQGDEYRGKIIHDTNRFQEKIHNKESKRINGLEEKRKVRRYKKLEEANSDIETYDSLSKDSDNDGIIDRYDNDFRDSDYFESTYDVDGLKKDDGIVKESKGKSYKRKNFSNKLYTRNKTKLEESTEKKDAKISEKSKVAIKNRHKQNILQEKGNGGKTNTLLLGVAKGQEVVRDYLSHGSDENTGVEAGEKTADTGSKLVHGIRRYSNKRKLRSSNEFSRQEFKLKKRRSKLEFRDEVKDLKRTEEYKKAGAYKKFQKRRQMKASIYKREHLRFRDRIKKNVIDTLKNAKVIVTQKAKGLMIIFIGLIILGTFVINFAGTSMTGMMNTTSSVLTTTYLSNSNVLSEINQQFSELEEGLQDEIDSIEENYPGYDEYILEKDGEIGHNTHELLSYITSRCGEIKDSSKVKDILEELFEKMYSISYREEIEIRYKTVTNTYIDEDGNEYTQSHEEPYEYKKLIITLKKKEMDTVVREIFSDYPNNILHYEALLASQGNMSDVFGSGNGDISEIINNPDFSNPGIAFNDVTVKALFNEAERHIGKRYVFGANGPNNFDCSSFVCWSFTHSGVKNMPRTTAWRIYTDYCNPVSPSEAKAGDIIFFKNTYNSGSPISHVGIYAGNGMMIHAGDPIQFVSIETPYWREHFYGFGRVRN